MSCLTKNLEARFLQSTISPQSSSKSIVIQLYFMLLIAIEDTMILKSTKSSKSHKIDLFTLPRHSTPGNLVFLVYSFKSIKSPASIRSRIPSMSPDKNQLCKHSTDSTDSVERRFRQSFNVNLALDVNMRSQIKVLPAKNPLNLS